MPGIVWELRGAYNSFVVVRSPRSGRPNLRSIFARARPIVSVSDVLLKLIVLKTDDVDRVCRFYQALGLIFTEERHGKGPLHHAAALDGGATLEVYPLAADRVVDNSTRLGFAVPDLDAVVPAAERLGARVIKPAHQTPWGTMALVEDPDGRTVELYRR